MQYGSNGNALGNMISNGSYAFSNPVFSSLAAYSSMALLKMFGLSTYTIVQRFRTMNFATPEDDIYKQLFNQLGIPTSTNSTTIGSKINLVERARNNHSSDLETIVPFILIGLFYVGTRPKFDNALWHFRIFLLSRVLHTIAYQVLTHVQFVFISTFTSYERNYSRFHCHNQHEQSRVF
jgi:glutathione S-transferase